MKMLRQEFIDYLELKRIDNRRFAFDEYYKDDCSIVRFENPKWIYYFCERGGWHSIRRFDTETEALAHLLHVLS